MAVPALGLYTTGPCKAKKRPLKGRNHRPQRRGLTRRGSAFAIQRSWFGQMNEASLFKQAQREKQGLIADIITRILREGDAHTLAGHGTFEGPIG